MNNHKKSYKFKKNIWIFFATIPIFAVAWLAAAYPTKIILYNDSPSVPEGFWLKTDQPEQKVGDVVAFHAPLAARRFITAHLPQYLTIPLIKPVAGVEGDEVCGNKNGFYVNGKLLGLPLAKDSKGDPVAPWTGCEKLRSGQIVVFSNRIKNSYDSRYYGPVPVVNIMSAYRQLWTW